jgi:hypothetical protein
MGKTNIVYRLRPVPWSGDTFPVKRCTVRVALLLSILVFSVTAFPSPSLWAYRDYLTPEQKALLDKIQTVREKWGQATLLQALRGRPRAEGKWCQE